MLVHEAAESVQHVFLFRTQGGWSEGYERGRDKGEFGLTRERERGKRDGLKKVERVVE